MSSRASSRWRIWYVMLSSSPIDPSDRLSSQRATPNPCIGPEESALRTSMSSMLLTGAAVSFMELRSPCRTRGVYKRQARMARVSTRAVDLWLLRRLVEGGHRLRVLLQHVVVDPIGRPERNDFGPDL